MNQNIISKSLINGILGEAFMAIILCFTKNVSFTQAVMTHVSWLSGACAAVGCYIGESIRVNRGNRTSRFH